MTRADERKQTFKPFCYADDNRVTVFPRYVWSVEDFDVGRAAQWIEGGLAPADRKALAEDFLRRFER